MSEQPKKRGRKPGPKKGQKPGHGMRKTRGKHPEDSTPSAPPNDSRAKAQNNQSDSASQFVARLQDDARTAADKAKMIELLSGKGIDQDGKPIPPMTLTGACRRAGVGRTTVYGWRVADPAFAQALKQARLEGVDVWVDRHAEKVWNGRESDIREHIFMLAPWMRAPDKFAAPGDDDAPVPEGAIVLDVEAMTAEERAQVKAILRRQSATKSQQMAR